MRARVITTFLVFVILLTASYNVLMVLPFGENFMLTMDAAAAPPFSGGDGSAGNPFQITNVSQLQNMSADLGAHYILISDIDASSTKTWNGGLGFSPIANDTNKVSDWFQGTQFSGSLDGQGYNITGLFINRTSEDYIALFGRIDSGAKVENVNLKNVNMTGDANVCGLIGRNDGTVANCSVSGTINGTSRYIGGLIGRNTRLITNCISSCNINGTTMVGGLYGGGDGGAKNCMFSGNINGTGDEVGGLVGATTGDIENCSANGNIISTGNSVGGLIGKSFSMGVISNCTAYVNITGTGNSIGGLVGENRAETKNCTAFGDVIGTGVSKNWIGGLAGFNGGPLDNCSAYGDVNGSGSNNGEVGGLIGRNGGIISNCISYGSVIGTGDEIGGLIGRNTAKVENCYSYGDTTGNDYVGALIGYIMSDKATNCTVYGNANGNEYVGGITGKNDGSVVNCSAYGNYSGYRFIGGVVGWNYLGLVDNCRSNVHITGIGADSNSLGGLMGYNFRGILTNSTSQSTIQVTGADCDNIGGLLGVNYEAMVSNCSAFVNMTGINDDIGGLIGNNYLSTVSNCFSTGVINSTGFDIGGLIGRNSGNIDNCSSSSYIISNNYIIGGLVGQNTGTINTSAFYGTIESGIDVIGGVVGYNSGGNILNCYSTGSVNGSDEVGGLVGNNSAGSTIRNCYSTGRVNGLTNVGGLIGAGTGSVYDSFWDNQTSTQTISIGGIGKYTAQMMTESTFTGAGWDFVNIWGIIEGTTYPFFGFWYNPPTIITQDVKTATEDILYYVDYEAYISNYPPFNRIGTWTLNTDADNWLTIDNNGVLSGTPSNADVGSYWVNVTVIDSMGGNDSHNFSLTVLNINDPPILTTSELQNATEDIFYFVELSALDIDPTGDTLTWTITTNASWLVIDNAFANISGTPKNADVGTYWVNVTVDDGKFGDTSTNFTLNVTNVNDDPVITTTDVTTATEDVLYSVDYETTDMDPTGDILTWSLSGDASWLNIDSGTGVLSGTPENADVGNYWANVSVSDGRGGLTWHYFPITVINVNDAPMIITTEIPNATEDSSYQVQLTATDIDPTSDTLTWAFTSDSSWLALNSTTGNLTGTPTNDDVGSHWVNVTVSDSNGDANWVNFTLLVKNVNDPPLISTEDVLTAEADKLYSVDYEATDIDPTGDTLTWSLNSNASWLSINSSTGVLSGTPSKTDAGTYSVKVEVADGNGGFDNHDFTITVPKVPITPPGNQNPIITTDDVLTAEVNKLYSVNYEATDEDTPLINLTWSVKTNASWITIDPSTGILSGTPKESNIGSYWIEVMVSDGAGGSASTNFTVTVKKLIEPENKNPVVTKGKMTPSSGDTKTEFTLSVTYTDENNDPGEVWVWIDGIKHEMTPDPEDDDFTDGVTYTYKTILEEGKHEYYFTASDGKEPAEAGDTTPIDADSADTTSKIVKPGEQEDDDNLMTYLAILIVIIIILILIAVAVSRRKKGEPQELEDEELEEE